MSKIIVNPVQTNIKQDQLRVRLGGKDGTRVLILKNGVLVSDIEWKVARDLGRALVAQAQNAEAIHWRLCEKRLGKQIQVKEMCGLPILRDEKELERL